MNSITQNIIPDAQAPSTLPVRHFERRHAGDLAARLEELQVKYAGIAIRQNDEARIVTLAIASPDAIYKISVNSLHELLGEGVAFAKLLRGESTTTLVGFGMGRLAFSIHRDFRLRVRGVDVPTMCSGKTSDPWLPAKILVDVIHNNIDRRQTNQLWAHLCEERDDQSVCLRAWLAARVAIAISPSKFNSVPRVDTSHLSTKELAFLEDYVAQCDFLDLVKPKEAPNEFTKSNTALGSDGKLRLVNARYRNRVRPSRQTEVIMRDSTGREFIGQAKTAHGRTTTIRLEDGAKDFSVGMLESVKVVGAQEFTSAERTREEFLLHLLQGDASASLKQSNLIRKLWFSSTYEQDKDEIDKQALSFRDFGLNHSQMVAAGTMTSTSPIVVVHGPPGTGKTTTISAAAKMWSTKRLPVWICAHSNVAVKNLAEALFKKKVDFKIVVSKDFYVEWHEHLYERIQNSLFRTDELPRVQRELEILLDGSKIILSTLSQLSNPGFLVNGMFDVVPLERLVIDEASQINVVEYLHIFGRFSKLNKVCFFGDPKQLPPYGKDRISSLKSIFDFPHVERMASMLKIQYRMPVPLGNFISQYVYGGRLQSEHTILEDNCIAFVDVSRGCEGRSGFSYTNEAESETVVNLVGKYYQHTDSFCVITPYDAQRALIEGKLKDAMLPWQSVFNVDSFQGNEADYVIISVVRTGRPGFMTLMERVNVMLTRCRKGMVIVANRDFLKNPNGGLPTLVGRLAQKLTSRWVHWVDVVGGDASLPGFPSLGTRRKNLDRPVMSVNYDWSSSSSVPSTRVSHSRLFAEPAPVKRLAPIVLNPPQPVASLVQQATLPSLYSLSHTWTSLQVTTQSGTSRPGPPSPATLYSPTARGATSPATYIFGSMTDQWDDTETLASWDDPTASPKVSQLASHFGQARINQSPTTTNHMRPQISASRLAPFNSEAQFPSLVGATPISTNPADSKPSSFSLLKKKPTPKRQVAFSPIPALAIPSSVGSTPASVVQRFTSQGGAPGASQRALSGEIIPQNQQRHLSSNTTGVFRIQGNNLIRCATHK